MKENKISKVHQVELYHILLLLAALHDEGPAEITARLRPFAYRTNSIRPFSTFQNTVPSVASYL